MIDCFCQHRFISFCSAITVMEKIQIQGLKVMEKIQIQGLEVMERMQIQGFIRDRKVNVPRPRNARISRHRKN